MLENDERNVKKGNKSEKKKMNRVFSVVFTWEEG
jgi:hypothetical protein